MRGPQPELTVACLKKCQRFFAVLCGLVLLNLTLAGSAKASFIGYYALSNFTLTNTDNGSFPSFTDGSVFSPDAGLSIVLTGGNSGSGIGGPNEFGAETDLFISAAASGMVQFDWAYFSEDMPGADTAGYLLNVVDCSTMACVFLSNTSGDFGHRMFAVTKGETFGFFVATVDNTGGPGVLTISNFSAPLPAGSPVSEPAASLLAALGLLTLLAGWLWSRRAERAKGVRP